MNPIINPMFYYLADMCNTIRVLSLAFFLESGVVLIFMNIFMFGESPYYNEEIKEYKHSGMFTKKQDIDEIRGAIKQLETLTWYIENNKYEDNEND